MSRTRPSLSCSLLLFFLLTAHANGQYFITTVAGGASPNGLAVSVPVGYPQALAIDAAGNVYVALGSQSCVLKVTPVGVATTLAGATAPGYSGDGGPAWSAQLNYPAGLAVDGAGNVYIADAGNHRVRKVSGGGTITTVAGNGIAGFSGDDGPAANAQINSPVSIALDGAGNLYIADAGNYRVRKVSGGVISTVAGNGVSGFAGDGGPAISAQLNFPSGIAVDAAGNLYIGDADTNRVRKVTGTTINTVAGSGEQGYGGDAGPATSAKLNGPLGLTVDGAGNLYIADTWNHRVRKVSGTTISTVAGAGSEGFAGDGGPATAALLDAPFNVALDSAGNLYIADGYNHRIRKVTAGTIGTIAGNGSVAWYGDGGPPLFAQTTAQSVAVDAAGNLYIADTDNHRVRKVSGAVISTLAGTGVPGDGGDNGPASAARLNRPSGVAVDAAGNVYIADTDNNRIRKVTPGGIIGTIAGNGTAGHTGDGALATNANIYSPFGIAVDGAGSIYFTEANLSSTVRKVSGGLISTVAGNGSYGYSGDGGPATNAQLNYPTGVAVDAAGNLYIADWQNSRVRKVSGGVITTLAGNGSFGFSGDGGPAGSAQLFAPLGVAVDASGDIFVADTWNNCVRRVSGGFISTVAGGGASGFEGIDAASAKLYGPSGVAAAGGKIYVADGGSQRVRLLSNVAPVPSITVRPMVLGFTYAAGGPTPAAQTLTVVSSTGGVLPVVATSWDPAWLTVTPAAAYTPATFTVIFNPTGLPAGNSLPGSFVEFVSAGAQNSPTTVPILVDLTACSYTLSPQAATLANAGGTGSIDVATGSGCSWTASSDSGWLTITGGATGTGAGKVGFSAPAYSGPAARTAMVTIAGQQAMVTQLGVPAPLAFIPVAPCRVSDTRTGAGFSGAFGPPAIATSTEREIPIPSGVCGIPATSKAYSLNVTVVPAGPLGYLTLWPSGQAQPNASTLNSLHGGIVANAAIVPAGSNGAIKVYASATADVIIDVNGYFVPAGTPNGLSLYTLAPCRFADTRVAAMPAGFGTPIIAAGSARAFNVPSSACGIPATAKAYSFNATVVPPGPLGYLTLWPYGNPMPVVSTLNSPEGLIAANAAIVPAGSGGAVSVFASAASDVVLDINGYFSTPGTAGALNFYAVPPCRVSDTRVGTGALGGPSMGAGAARDIPVPSSSCGIPPTAKAYSLNLTVVPPGPLGYLTAWPSGTIQPVVSTLNSLQGRILANAAIVPAGANGSISIFTSSVSDVIVDINGYFAP